MSVAIDKVEKEFGKVHKKVELAKQAELEAARAAEEAKANVQRIMKEELVMHALIASPTGTPEEILRIAERIGISHQLTFDDLNLTVTEVIERFKEQDNEAQPKTAPKARGKVATISEPIDTTVEVGEKPKRHRRTKAQKAADDAAAKSPSLITFPGAEPGDDDEDEYDDED